MTISLICFCSSSNRLQTNLPFSASPPGITNGQSLFFRQVLLIGCSGRCLLHFEDNASLSLSLNSKTVVRCLSACCFRCQRPLRWKLCVLPGSKASCLRDLHWNIMQQNYETLISLGKDSPLLGKAVEWKNSPAGLVQRSI